MTNESAFSHPSLDPCALWEQSEPATVCGVDVQKYFLFAAKSRNFFNWINACSRRCADSGDDRERLESVPFIARNRLRQSGNIHAEFRIAHDVNDILFPQSKGDGGFVR